MDLPDTDSEDELPPGWEERCTADGLVFYAHHSNKTTQWTHPRTGKRKRVTGEMPYGWERQITSDGKVFFVDHIHHKTTNTDPRLAFAVEENDGVQGLRQRFDSYSTGLQILHGKDLSSQVAIVTGANSGVGFETARSLAFHGCTVIMACRDLIKAQAAIQCMSQQRSNLSCRAMHLDLSSLKSVHSFVMNYLMLFQTCNILILNAGVFGLPFSLTTDGLETTFQVNHLSQFYLALLLKSALIRSSPARIVFVSAESHRFATLSMSNISETFLSPTSERMYSYLNSYNNSKLCNILTACEFEHRFGVLGVHCFAVHPGNVLSTRLPRHSLLYRLIFAIVRPFTKSLQQACATSVFCGASDDLASCGGLYVNNCVPCLPSHTALDGFLANKLWVTSLLIIERILGKHAFDAEPQSL